MSAITRLPPEYYAGLREALLGIDPDMALDEQLFFDTLDGQTDVVDQLRTMCRYTLETEMMVDALVQRLRELRERKARFEARAGYCRELVNTAMQELGIKNLPAPDFTARIQAGRPHVIPDLDKLPDEFKRITVEPRLREIAKALEAGEKVEGAVMSNPGLVLHLGRV